MVQYIGFVGKLHYEEKPMYVFTGEMKNETPNNFWKFNIKVGFIRL